MAKRQQPRIAVEDMAGLPELQDDSHDLWDESFGRVSRGLLTAAVRCFALNGFHGTTTRDIASAVGLSPGALYVHFPSKEIVLHEIIRSGHERVLEHIRAPEVEQATDPAEKLRLVVSRYTEWHARHHVAARVSQYDLAALSAEHYDEILRLRHRTNRVFRDVVAEGVQAGVFAEVDVKRVARAMLSLAIDLVRWYRKDGTDTPEQLGEFNARMALIIVTHAQPQSLR